MDDEEGATLIDVPRLFVDDEFQRYKVSKCKNAVVRNFWTNEIAKTGQRERRMIPVLQRQVPGRSLAKHHHAQYHRPAQERFQYPRGLWTAARCCW